MTWVASQVDAFESASQIIRESILNRKEISVLTLAITIKNKNNEAYRV